MLTLQAPLGLQAPGMNRLASHQQNANLATVDVEQRSSSLSSSSIPAATLALHFGVMAPSPPKINTIKELPIFDSSPAVMKKKDFSVPSFKVEGDTTLIQGDSKKKGLNTFGEITGTPTGLLAGLSVVGGRGEGPILTLPIMVEGKKALVLFTPGSTIKTDNFSVNLGQTEGKHKVQISNNIVPLIRADKLTVNLEKLKPEEAQDLTLGLPGAGWGSRVTPLHNVKLTLPLDVNNIAYQSMFPTVYAGQGQAKIMTSLWYKFDQGQAGVDKALDKFRDQHITFAPNSVTTIEHPGQTDGDAGALLSIIKTNIGQRLDKQSTVSLEDFNLERFKKAPGETVDDEALKPLGKLKKDYPDAVWTTRKKSGKIVPGFPEAKFYRFLSDEHPKALGAIVGIPFEGTPAERMARIEGTYGMLVTKKTDSGAKQLVGAIEKPNVGEGISDFNTKVEELKAIFGGEDTDYDFAANPATEMMSPREQIAMALVTDFILKDPDEKATALINKANKEMPGDTKAFQSSPGKEAIAFDITSMFVTRDSENHLKYQDILEASGALPYLLDAKGKILPKLVFDPNQGFEGSPFVWRDSGKLADLAVRFWEHANPNESGTVDLSEVNEVLVPGPQSKLGQAINQVFTKEGIETSGPVIALSADSLKAESGEAYLKQLGETYEG